MIRSGKAAPVVEPGVEEDVLLVVLVVEEEEDEGVGGMTGR